MRDRARELGVLNFLNFQTRCRPWRVKFKRVEAARYVSRSRTNVYVEPLAPTHGLTVNGAAIFEPKKLSKGDVVSVPGASFKITFVKMIG